MSAAERVVRCLSNANARTIAAVPNCIGTNAALRHSQTVGRDNHERGVAAEDLLAERVVIKMYGDIVRFFGDADPVSRRLFEEIRKDEEDHAGDIADLLYTVDLASGTAAEEFTGDSTLRPSAARASIAERAAASRPQARRCRRCMVGAEPAEFARIGLGQ